MDDDVDETPPLRLPSSLCVVIRKRLQRVETSSPYFSLERFSLPGENGTQTQRKTK